MAHGKKETEKERERGGGGGEEEEAGRLNPDIWGKFVYPQALLNSAWLKHQGNCICRVANAVPGLTQS